MHRCIENLYSSQIYTTQSQLISVSQVLNEKSWSTKLPLYLHCTWGTWLHMFYAHLLSNQRVTEEWRSLVSQVSNQHLYWTYNALAVLQSVIR